VTGARDPGPTGLLDQDPVVHTSAGDIRGRRCADGGAQFLAVPYAAAPTGHDRFRPPRPHAGWRGVRDAIRPGPTAPQPVRSAFGVLDMSPYFGPGWRRGEEYLTVDVRIPAPDRQPAPVLVFVHGGGFLAGSNAAPLYNGAAFARDGVVLVTVNYRLGVAGFVSLPDAPDNRGLLDVLAALRWVSDNAAAFGGDPARVTLAGQSAGAVLVAGALADPSSGGLIRRAIVQSGSGTAAQTSEQGQLVAQTVADALDVAPTARSLGALTDDRLVEVLPALAGLDLRTATHPAPLGAITPFSLVLKEQPAAAVAAGRSAGVDLLAGTTSDEAALYLAPVGLLDGSTEADMRAVAAQFSNRPDDLLAAYRSQHPAASVAELRTQVLGDGLFGTGTRRLLAAHAPGPAATYGYTFSWRSDAVDGRLGACHTLELPFVFDCTGLLALHGPSALLGTAAVPAGLAGAVHRTWVDFVATGNPGSVAGPHFRVARVDPGAGPAGPVAAAWESAFS